MATTETATTVKAEAYAVLQRAVCVTLTFRQLGNNRKVDVEDLVESVTEGGQRTGSVDDSVFHAKKRLLDPKVLRPCSRITGIAKGYMRGMSLPMHQVFGTRTYLVPVCVVEEVDRQLESFRDKLREETEQLAKVYDAAKEEQRTKLGVHFKESDYLTPEEVLQSFSMDWAYVSFSSPERLETVSMALAERSRAKYEERLSAAYHETVGMLRESARDIMKGLADRLSPGEDGKPKALRATVLDDLVSFCQRLPALNSIACDDELAEALKDMQQSVSGLSVSDIRDSDELRGALAKLASATLQQLEEMVVETRGRAISFGELS